MPAISVIIPAYNRANYVTKAIDSVLAQTYTDYEIIVVDDGSTDNTKDVLQPYMDRINYIYQENRGVSAARNTGIQVASGNWMAFLDSDDIWLPEKLSIQMEYINRVGAKVCFTNVVHVGIRNNTNRSKQNGEEVFKEPFDLILQDSFVLYVQSLLIEKKLLQKLGGYDERLKVAEDTRLIYNLAFETPFAYIHMPLVHINRDNQRKGLTDLNPNVRRAMCQAHIEIISEAYFRCLNKHKLITRKLRYMLGHFLSARSLINCVDKNYSDARRSALDALHFGGEFRTYRRSIAVLLLPWFMSWMRRNTWR